MRSRRRGRFGGALSIALVGVLLAACGGDGGRNARNDSGELVIDGELIADAELMESATGEGTLIIYGNRIEPQTLPLLDAFTEASGIEAEYVRLPPDRLFERVMTEYRADILEADVVLISDVNLIDEMRETGVLEAHRIPSWDNIPAEFRHPDGYYYASILGLMLIAYNSELVDAKDVPPSWEELVNERWAGRLGLTPPSVGGSAWSLALFQRQEYDVEHWESLATLKPRIYPSAAGLGEDLVRGEVAIAALPEVVAFRHQTEGAPVGIVWPEDGIPAFPGYTGITSTGNNKNAAKVFVNWMQSRAGQEETGRTAGSFSVRSDVSDPRIEGVDLPPRDDLDLVVAPNDDWIALREEWVADWNRVFGYND